ncbi:MAG: bacillithiol biosynthesis deacetylase BshB1 [Candidatus Thorarchaeota archaeon]
MLDVLIFAPHPDDAELGLGGTIIKAVNEGIKIGIIDLTAGEMGTYGSKELRLQEAENAKKVLGVEFRENLGLPDGYIGIEITKEMIFSVANKICQYKPKIVMVPNWIDRHPDHEASSIIVTKAIHYSKLEKIKLDYPKHKVDTVIYYELNNCFTQASFIIDISDTFIQKKEAIMSFKSQFKEFTKENLPFPVPERCLFYGSLINAKYGEAFLIKNSINLNSISIFLKKSNETK